MKRWLLAFLFTAVAWSQYIPPGGGGGIGGSSGAYSSPSATYSGTEYLPPGGGLAASATETSVQGLVTIAGTISNFSAKVSAAPGAGNTLTFTWRDNTTSQAVTCAISGGTATSCSDITHNFAIAVNDLIDIQIVASSSVAEQVVLQWGTPGTQGPTGATGPAGPTVYPAAGIPNSPGVGGPWGTSFQVGVAANDIVQLNGSAQLPAVSAALLTNFPTFNQNTTGNAATATALAAIPTQCTGGQFSTGNAANGNANCSTPAGSGNVNGPGSSTDTFVPQWNGTTGTSLRVGIAVSTTPGANTIVEAGAGGTIAAGWVPILNQNTTGNAATATALAAVPTQCTGGQFSTGNAANGNANCSTPAGSGNVSGPGSSTSTFLPQWSGTSGTVLSAGLPVSTTPGANTVVESGSGSTISASWIPTLNQNTTGNAATATALAALPSLCTTGNAPTGVLANGNATGCSPITTSAQYTYQVPDWRGVRTSATVLTWGANCAIATPCRVGPYTFTAGPYTATESNTHTGNGFFYIDIATGNLDFGFGGGTFTSSDVTGGTGVNTVFGITAYPANTVSLERWNSTTTAGNWDTLGTEDFTVFQMYPILNGSGNCTVVYSGTGNLTATVSCTQAQPTITPANSGTTGTTLNTLTKLTTSNPSTAVIAATSDTSGVIGITTGGAGTTGNATVQYAGIASCIFSSATTAGHYVQISTATNGDCVDTGSAAYPTTGGQIVGRVLSTNGSAGTYSIDLFPAEIQASTGGGGGGGNVSGPGTSTVGFAPLWSNTAGTGIGVGLPVSATAAANTIVESGSGGTISASWIPTLNQNTTGNAATATNLASYPALCTGGQFSEGLSAGSNNCGTPSGGGGSAGGTVVPVTTSCTFNSTCSTSSDGGKLFVLTGATAETGTLPSAPPTMPWSIGLQNNSTATWTIARNGNTINGVAANFSVYSGQSSFCASDTVTGGNYVCNNTVQIQTNGTSNANQITLNLSPSTVNSTGLTVTPSNALGGAKETFEITGSLLNAALANSSVTLNGQTVALGASGNIPFQVNGTNNTSLAGLNLITSVTNGIGLIATPSNSGTDQVKWEITGTVSSSGIAANAVTLAKLATQTADTVLMNASGTGAVPTAVGMPTGGTNGCAGASNALGYNTTTHAWVCNTLSGSGGTGNAADLHTVTFSATPTFTCGSSSAGTTDAFQLSTALSANITSSTLSGCTSGQTLTFTFTQASSGGPFTVAMPTGFSQAPQVSPIASAATTMSFYWDGTTAWLLAGQSTSGPGICPTISTPSGTPASSTVWNWCDSTSNLSRAEDSSGNLYDMAKELTAGAVRVAGGVNTSDSAATAANLSSPKYISGGGSANAQTATLTPAVASLTNGLEIWWLPTAANTTTTPTLAVNGLAAKTIVKVGGALVASDLVTTAIAHVIYDGTNWELQNPQTTASGVSSVTGSTPINSSGGATPAISCPTCVNATSPGIGLAHFAGSTQTVTSSAVALGGADVTGTLGFSNGGLGTNTNFTNHQFFGNNSGSTAVPVAVQPTFSDLAAGTVGAKATFPGGDLFYAGVNAQTGTTYTVQTTDANKLVTYNNASSVAVTLPQATTSGFTSGAFFPQKNIGIGTVTITPTTSTINGAATLVLATNQDSVIYSDGTNYWATVDSGTGNTVIGGTCTNQVATAIAAITGAPTCTTITSAYVNNSIAQTGADINTSNQVTVTHLASPLPVNQGGTGDSSVTAYAPVLGGTTSTGAMQSAAVGTSGQIFISKGSAAVPVYIDFPERLQVPAANCNNTTAGAGWSIGSGGTVACRPGTNNLGGYISITDTSSTFAQFQLSIPADWDTATDPYILFGLIAVTDTTSGHTVIPQIRVSCPTAVNGTVTDDHAFAAAHSATTITFGGSAVANGFYTTSVQMNSTDMTGCVAGGMMIVQVGRATDTATGTIGFEYANVTFPRLLVLQAN